MNLAADRGLSPSPIDWSGDGRTESGGRRRLGPAKRVGWTNSIVVRGEDGLILIDPGIHGSELEQLADAVDRLGIPVVAGFSTHPHWDHLLWHSPVRRRAALRHRRR